MRPKNWSTFQHYKDRRPPWIKLHRSLLEDEDFDALRGDDVKYLIKIWLIASEHENGDLPSVARLAYRLHMPAQKAEQLVSRLQAWLTQDASESASELPAIPQAKRYSHARSQEGETEKRQRRGEGDAREALPPQPAPLRVAELVQPDWESDEEATVPDDLPAPELGRWLLSRLSIPWSFALAGRFAEAVDLLARDEGLRRDDAMRALLRRAREAPQGTKWTFWLQDGGWKQTQAAGVSTEGWE